MGGEGGEVLVLPRRTVPVCSLSPPPLGCPSNYRRRSEGQSLRPPPLDCPTSCRQRSEGQSLCVSEEIIFRFAGCYFFLCAKHHRRFDYDIYINRSTGKELRSASAVPVPHCWCWLAARVGGGGGVVGIRGQVCLTSGKETSRCLLA